MRRAENQNIDVAVVGRGILFDLSHLGRHLAVSPEDGIGKPVLEKVKASFTAEDGDCSTDSAAWDLDPHSADGLKTESR